jgi:mannitol/fructose-specific phosphotransferase system IIA component (Ntr-type)
VILGELLREEVIIPALASKKKSAAIRELVHAIVEAGDLPAELEIDAAKAVSKREKAAPTGMEMGVALPHGTVPGLERVRAALGISEAGIDFGALDKKRSHVILLMLLPRNQFNVHVATLAAVAVVLSDDFVRQALNDAKSAEDVLRLIRGEERRPSFLRRFLGRT